MARPQHYDHDGRRTPPPPGHTPLHHGYPHQSHAHAGQHLHGPHSQHGHHVQHGQHGHHVQHGQHGLQGLHGLHAQHGKHGSRAGNRSIATDGGDSSDEDHVGKELENKPLSSFVVHGLASDIQTLESRCQQLEERNKWLTSRLLTAQKKFIARTVLSGGRMKLQSSFEGWKGAMSELRLERHLHEQTRSLDQCQQVAQELGDALSQEQASRSHTESAHSGTRVELQKALEEERRLTQHMHAGSRRIELLEKRVHEAEQNLCRFRSEAQEVVNAANLYERQVRELEEESKQRGEEHPENPLEHSMKLREQAQGTMQKVTALLHHKPSSSELN